MLVFFLFSYSKSLILFYSGIHLLFSDIALLPACHKTQLQHDTDPMQGNLQKQLRSAWYPFVWALQLRLLANCWGCRFVWFPAQCPVWAGYCHGESAKCLHDHHLTPHRRGRVISTTLSPHCSNSCMKRLLSIKQCCCVNNSAKLEIPRGSKPCALIMRAPFILKVFHTNQCAASAMSQLAGPMWFGAT